MIFKRMGMNMRIFEAWSLISEIGILENYLEMEF